MGSNSVFGKSIGLLVLIGVVFMASAMAQPFKSSSDDVSFSAHYSKVDLGWDSGWWPGGGEEPGASTIQVRLNFTAAANVNADVAGQYVLEHNQLSPGAASGQWDYALGVLIGMKVAININYNLFGFQIQPFIVDVPFVNVDLLANQATTFDTYLLDSTSSLSQTTDPVKIYDFDLIDLIIGQFNWPDWLKSFLNGGVTLKASFQIDGSLGCDNMTASDGIVFTSEGQQLPVDLSVNPYQTYMAYNENFTWDVVVHAIPTVFISILGSRWDYPVLDIPWQVYQGPIDLAFNNDSLTLFAEEEGEGEGSLEGEGEEEPCPVACEIPCDGVALNAGVAAALTALFSTPQFTCNPDLCDTDQNGMVDVTQVKLLDFILNNPSVSTFCCVRAAWDANSITVQGWLDAANTGLFTILSKETFQTLFTGVATDGSPAMITAMLGILSQAGVSASLSEVDRSAAQYLGAAGDADLDGVCNFAEYNAAGGDALGYVLAALDPATTLNGGGCGLPCFPDLEGEGTAEGEGEGTVEGAVEGEGEENTPPEITVLGANPVTVECHAEYVDEGANAYDAQDGDISAQVVVDNPVNTLVPGVYTVTYTASDSAGSQALPKTRTVEVVDSLAPALMLLGDAEVTLECGAQYTDAGVTALDACDGDLSGRIQVTGTVNLAVPGDYSVSATATDAAGNVSAPVTRIFHIVDTHVPVITLMGDATVTVACGTNYTDAGATVWDSCAGNITASLQVSSTVDTSRAGAYSVTYAASDPSGNAAVPVTRTVIVECPYHKADQDQNGRIGISELLRVIQLFNSGGYHCDAAGEDGYAPGAPGDTACAFHSSDYAPADWSISISELLRLIQFYNFGGYHPCAEGEDGFCPGV